MSDEGPVTVRTLIVDDQDGDREVLRRTFTVAPTRDYRFSVEEARSVAEYYEKIREGEVGVLVVDVLLGARHNGGGDIVDFHLLHSPATIVIVCSGFSGLNPLPVCVHAVRAGAVDCISKEDPRWTEAVLQSVLDELNRRNSPGDGPTPVWLEQNLTRLTREYPGQAVGMIGQEVVAWAPSVADLRAKLPALNLSHMPFLMMLPPGGR